METSDLVVKVAVAILLIWAGFLTNGALQQDSLHAEVNKELENLQETTVSDAELLRMENRMIERINDLGAELKDCIYAVNNGRDCVGR